MIHVYNLNSWETEAEGCYVSWQTEMQRKFQTNWATQQEPVSKKTVKTKPNKNNQKPSKTKQKKRKERKEKKREKKKQQKPLMTDLGNSHEND